MIVTPLMNIDNDRCEHTLVASIMAGALIHDVRYRLLAVDAKNVVCMEDCKSLIMICKI